VERWLIQQASDLRSASPIDLGETTDEKVNTRLDPLRALCQSLVAATD